MASFTAPLNNFNEVNEASTAAGNAQNYEPSDFDIRPDLLQGLEPEFGFPGSLANNSGVQQPTNMFDYPQQPQQAYNGYDFGIYQPAQNMLQPYQTPTHYQPLTGQDEPHYNHQNAPQVQNVSNVYYGYGNTHMPVINNYNSGFVGQTSRQVQNQILEDLYDWQADGFVQERAHSFWSETCARASTLANTSPKDEPSQVPSPTTSLLILPLQQQQDGSQSPNAVANLGDEVDITEVPLIDLTAEEEAAAPSAPAPKPRPQAPKKKSNPSWLNTSANIEEAARKNSAEILIKAQEEQGRARLKERQESQKEQKEKRARTKQALKEKGQKSQSKKRKTSDTDADNSSKSPNKKICSSPEKAVEELSTTDSGSVSQYTEDEMADLEQVADDCDQEFENKTKTTPQRQYSDEEAEELAQLFFEEQDAEEAAQKPATEVSQDDSSETAQDPASAEASEESHKQESESESESETEEKEDAWSLEEDLFGDSDFLLAS